MKLENQTLGGLLSDPRIALIAPDAIRRLDITAEPAWNKTLAEIRDEHIFSGDLCAGFARLFRAAETGDWYYPLYTEDECTQSPARKGTNLLWLPSDDPAANDRPYIFLVPGGGFVNVWSLTEGWPVAAQFNRLGYHVMILTYQVDGEYGLLEKNMEDFARAFRLIRENEAHFHVQAGRYITCGFSAGGYLVCLWNTKKGYPAFHWPKPQAVFPIYPVTTLRQDIRYGSPDPEDALRLYGCSLEEARKSDYEILDHAEGFPPCALFLADDDGLVNPDNSRLLAEALKEHSTPCRLEIGPYGGHGFADGTGMCMAGWTERAVRWAESQESGQSV